MKCYPNIAAPIFETGVLWFPKVEMFQGSHDSSFKGPTRMLYIACGISGWERKMKCCFNFTRHRRVDVDGAESGRSGWYT